MTITNFKKIGKLFTDAFGELRRNEPLRLAGATAFFTTFALPPILIILVQIIGMVFSINDLRSRFFSHLSDLLGRQSAEQVRLSFMGFTSMAKNWWLSAVGFVFLMFVATTIFKVIKDSINQLWNVKAAHKHRFKRQLVNRAISLVMILVSGLLFLGAMLFEAFQAFLYQYAQKLDVDNVHFISSALNQFFSLLIVAVWFSVLFKVLPDAKVHWRVVITGGLFTGVMFTFGKILIRYMLSFGNLSNIFGASSSIVLLLLFVFYTSFILYYGACFTKVYGAFIQHPIEPKENAIKYKMVEVSG